MKNKYRNKLMKTNPSVRKMIIPYNLHWNRPAQIIYKDPKGDRIVLGRTTRTVELRNARGETMKIREGHSYINGRGSKGDKLRIGNDTKGDW